MTASEDTYVAGLADEIAAKLADKLDTRPLLTIPQAGEKLALSSRTVYKMIVEGSLRAVKVGPGDGVSRIEQREVDRYVAQQRESGDEA